VHTATAQAASSDMAERDDTMDADLRDPGVKFFIGGQVWFMVTKDQRGIQRLEQA